MDELLADFVAETREMLEASQGEIVAWEANPNDRSRLDTIFRFVHTVKGNCGFFDLPRLANLSHAAEDALADCRNGRREPNAALVSAVLAIIDRIVAMVDAVEAGEEFAADDDDALIAALDLPGGQQDSSTGQDTALQDQAGDLSPISSDNSPKEASASKAPEQPTIQRSIRLPVDLLDRVMSGVSDMVLARNDLAHRLRQAGTQPTIDGPFERLTAILADVRDAITRMRMQRVETLFSAFPRLVRDLAAELGKQVIVDLEGGDVELDREMIEMIRDPLIHIIRNAIDHGMETPAERAAAGKLESGFLSIAARQSGNTISIVVSDDGAGLDEEKIGNKAVEMGLVTPAELSKMDRDKLLQLIFEPGFSTARQVSNVSGRGVGLDVVRDNLERVGGSIKVSSSFGVGTLFTLQIPLTLSIIAGLTVEVAGQRFAIPQSYVEEIVLASSKALDFSKLGETALVTFRGNRVPCVMLSEVLQLERSREATAEQTMVMLRLASGDLFALAVDQIHSHGDMVVKPLAPAIMREGLYAGATLLDDGKPVLLLDITNIAQENGLVSDARGRVMNANDNSGPKATQDACRVMLFSDLTGRRKAIRLELVQRIETAPASAIDLSGNRPRAVIDNVILPLVGLPEGTVPSEKVRLLRLSDGSCELLHAVSALDDAAELTSALKPADDDPMIEAVTLVKGETVSIIDGHALFAQFGEAAQAAQKPLCRLPDSDWARTILGPLVTSAGYDITTDDLASEDVAIWFDDEYEVAKALDLEFNSPIVRLRDVPEAPQGTETVYRYDREGVVNALREARQRSAGASQ